MAVVRSLVERHNVVGVQRGVGFGEGVTEWVPHDAGAIHAVSLSDIWSDIWSLQASRVALGLSFDEDAGWRAR